MRSEEGVQTHPKGNPEVIKDLRIPEAEKGEPRYSVEELEKIINWLRDNCDAYTDVGSEVLEFIAELNNLINNPKKIKEILNEQQRP